jgi:hypothetical protein
LQFWAGLALAIAGLGAGAVLFLNRYAEAANLDKVSEQLQKHVKEEAERIGAVEARGKDIEEDYHWQRDQLQRIAESVGAERVPLPKH